MAFRLHDPALGRWNAVDPVTHWEFSPYSAFDNNPVFYSDPMGADSDGTGTTIFIDIDWTVVNNSSDWGMEYNFRTGETTIIDDSTLALFGMAGDFGPGGIQWAFNWYEENGVNVPAMMMIGKIDYDQKYGDLTDQWQKLQIKKHIKAFLFWNNRLSGVDADSNWRQVPVVSSFIEMIDWIGRGDYQRAVLHGLWGVTDIFGIKSTVSLGYRAVVAGEIWYARTSVNIANSAMGSANRLKSTTQATSLGVSAARTLGMAGEEAVGVASSAGRSRIPSLTRTANYRIPDGLTETTLIEVKNVANQSLTGQLRDFLLYSQSTGRQMMLYTRSTTTLSGPLQALIDEGAIIHKIIPGM